MIGHLTAKNHVISQNKEEHKEDVPFVTDCLAFLFITRLIRQRVEATTEIRKCIHFPEIA